MTSPSESAPPCDGFVCVCVQKEVELDVVDKHLHRAAKDRELHEELEKLSSAGPSQYSYQLGGGCRIVVGGGTPDRPIYIASWADSVAAFEGNLTNLEDLAKSYPPSLTVTSTVTGETTTPNPPVHNEGGATNPAELICIMYATVGMELLARLRGKFSFCLYKAKTGRVLAARDGSGTVPLFQGLSPNESLVISSNKAFVATCHDVKEFEPGHFKYGWYAEPRKFSLSSLNLHHFGHDHGMSPSSTRVPHRHSGTGCSSGGKPNRRHSLDQRNNSSHAQSGDFTTPGKGSKPGVSEEDNGGWNLTDRRHQHLLNANRGRSSLDSKHLSGGHASERRGSIDKGHQIPGGRRGSIDKSAGQAIGGRPRGSDAGRPAASAASPSQPGAPTCLSNLTFKLDINAPEFTPPKGK